MRGKNMESNIHKIELQVEQAQDIQQLLDMADGENIDVIVEKNFTGDLTTIELYASLTANIILVLVPVIKSLIKEHKVSSIKIDGDKIEVENVTQDMLEKILTLKFQQNTNEQAANAKKKNKL